VDGKQAYRVKDSGSGTQLVTKKREEGPFKKEQKSPSLKSQRGRKGGDWRGWGVPRETRRESRDAAVGPRTRKNQNLKRKRLPLPPV